MTASNRYHTLAGHLVNAMLFVVVAAALIIGDRVGGLAVALALAGIAAWWRWPARDKTAPDIDVGRDEKLLLFAFSLFALIGVISWALAGADFASSRELVRYLALFLAFPLLALLLRIRPDQTLFWLAIFTAALIAGVAALYQAVAPVNDSAVPFMPGSMALLLAFMSLAGSKHFYGRNGCCRLSMLGLSGFVAGLAAAVLSPLSVSWLALPLLALVAVLLFDHHRPAALLVIGMLTVVFILVVRPGVESYFTDMPPVSAEARDLSGDPPPAVRMALWQEALRAFADRPLAGTGVSRFETLVGSRIVDEYWPVDGAELRHTHNDFLHSLATRGVAGGLSLLLLFAIPLVTLLRYLTTDSSEVRHLAVTGLLLVTGYGLFAITGSVLESGSLVILYIVLLVWLHVLLRRARQASFTGERACSLSVILITKDEQRLVEGCLQSVLPVADEIIVLDSGSTDRTVELARQYTDRVEVTDWPGFGPQKQRALERATSDWVLSIDADEQLTPFLAREINHVLSRERGIGGYRLPWGVTIYGKRLDFGRSARAPLRLFRRAAARFSDDVVHESIVLPEGSRTSVLAGRLLHFTHRDYGHALQKSASYAWLGAQRKYDRGKRGGLLHATIWALLTFVHIYIIRLGILDGRVGYLVAVQYAQTNFNKYAGLWTMYQQDRLGRRNQDRDTS